MADDVIFIGDFNIDLFKIIAYHVKRYVELLETFNLHQIVDKLTRVGLNSCTFLDHIIISKLLSISAVNVYSNRSISDHYAVASTFDMPGFCGNVQRFIQNICEMLIIITILCCFYPKFPT